MIQRIQSIYLLLGALCLLGLFFFDGVWVTAYEAQPWFQPAVAGLALLTALVAAAAIFLYKNRLAQRRVVVGLQLLTVVLLAVYFAGLFLAEALAVRDAEGVFDTGKIVALLLPIVAYILFSLARRGIDRDIALVKSMDRLR